MQTFHQLFDETSSTYTYLLIDADTHEAVLIDPVDRQYERDLGILADTGAKLAWVVETHAHADHITSAGHLAQQTGATRRRRRAATSSPRRSNSSTATRSASAIRCYGPSTRPGIPPAA
jgi:glyoxylase-like metal-dependent hydrolase (beta-lactamase superfamily II)